LLGVAKARLVATLRARGVPWIDDPANRVETHERVRLRARHAEREALGLTDAMLGLAARRLARARRTLDSMAERFCDSGAVAADPCGVLSIDRTRFGEAGEEVALRVLGRAIAAAGGSAGPVPLTGLEAIAGEVLAGVPADGRWTLARAMITATRNVLTVEREPPRGPLPTLTLAAGERALWDGRFAVAVAPGFAGGGIEVRALGEAALGRLLSQGAAAPACPARAAALVPAFCREDEIVAVPPLSCWAAPEQRAALAAGFVGIGNPALPARPEGDWHDPDAC
jgi:tRNA(Ile)-lysidine synthase